MLGIGRKDSIWFVNVVGCGYNSGMNPTTQWLMTGAAVLLAALTLSGFGGMPPEMRDKLAKDRRLQAFLPDKNDLKEMFGDDGRVTPRYRILFVVVLGFFVLFVWVVLPHF